MRELEAVANKGFAPGLVPTHKPNKQAPAQSLDRWQQVRNTISTMVGITVYGLFIISTAILLLDSFTSLDITSSIIIFTIRFLSYSTFAIILIGFLLKKKGDRLILYSGLIVGLLFIISFPFSWNPNWNTQTIKYQNLHQVNRTIEFQMQDFGALGSNRRIVDRIKIFPYFDWTKEINIDNIDTLTWRKVEISVN